MPVTPSRSYVDLTRADPVAVSAPAVLLSDRLVADGWVLVAAGQVVATASGPPPAVPTLALPSGVLAPGLVDAQCNGGWGEDLMQTDEAGWLRWRSLLPSTGVSAVLPTVITAPLPDLIQVLGRLAGWITSSPELDARGGAAAPGAARPGSRPFARALGVHLEGPFLAPSRAGAHDPACLLDPGETQLDALLAAAAGTVRVVTLAPERPGAIPAVRRLTAGGIRVAIGHSDASDVEVAAAVDAGARLVTHLFNAQRPLHHRDPGVVGAALAEPRLVCGLIADGVHVAPTALRVAFTAARGRVMLVSDATAALGLPAGPTTLAGEPCEARDGLPPIRPDGTLAGAATGLDQGIATAIAAGVDPAAALTAATRIPADALGMAHLGRLAPGFPADLVWLDRSWRARATWIDGQLAHGDPQELADHLVST